MFAPTSSRPLSGKGTGAHDYVPEQDEHLPSRGDMPTDKDKTAADVEGSAARNKGTHTASIDSRQGSARPAIKKSSLSPSERREVEKNAELAVSASDDQSELEQDGHPHLLHGSKLTSEPKSLNQPGVRGERELEGIEGHHTVKGHELRGNGVHGHKPDQADDVAELEGPDHGEGMSATSRPPVTERIIGRAQVLVGKVKRDTELMERGLHRQRQTGSAGSGRDNAQAATAAVEA